MSNNRNIQLFDIVALLCGIAVCVFLFRQINLVVDKQSVRVDLYIKAFSGLLVAFSALFAAATYFRNGRLDRAKWISELHEKFFESEKYAEIRKLLDYKKPEERYQALADSFPNNEESNNIDDEEKLVNYLNFFEFIAVLEKRGQLTIGEINDTFGYYILTLNQHKWLKDSLTSYQFKNLPNLINMINIKNL